MASLKANDSYFPVIVKFWKTGENNESSWKNLPEKKCIYFLFFLVIAVENKIKSIATP